MDLAGISLLTIDYPLSKYSTPHGWTSEVHRALLSIEPFGSPYRIAVTLLALVTLSRERLRDAVCIGIVGVTGGLSAGLVKLLVGRTRPDHFDFDHLQVLDSFQGVLPFLSNGEPGQSFPSAHTATAVAFAVAMTYHFPHAQWLCYSLAALVGLQRIEAGQHFPSDVFAGAAVGWMVAKGALAIWSRHASVE